MMCFAALLETKSEQKVVNVTNRDLQTPLHRAVMFNRVHCAEFLLEKLVLTQTEVFKILLFYHAIFIVEL